MKNKIVFTIGSVIVFLAIVSVMNQPAEEAKGGSIVQRKNLLGSSTTTTSHFTSAATTSAVMVVGNDTDILDLDIYPVHASSTATIAFQVMKSTSQNCAVPNYTQNWVDALQVNTVTNVVGITINPATTTVHYIPTTGSPGKGATFRLTNVNSTCIKVYLGATNVNVYMQGIAKTLSF